MKRLSLALIASLLLTSPALGVEYQGKNIDGKRFAAKVHSLQTSGVYDATVEFNRQWVKVYFAGGQTTLQLTQSVITDPNAIGATGRLGQIPIGRRFSIGLDYDRSMGSYPSPDVPTRNDTWRISLDPAELNQFIQQQP